MKMKINMNTEILALNGKPIPVQGEGENKALCASTVLANALLESPGQGEPRLSGEEQLQRWRLAQKVHAGGEVELAAEDVVLCKKQVSRCYGPLIAGQVLELLG